MGAAGERPQVGPGPYLKGSPPKDPWGNRYSLNYQSGSRFEGSSRTAPTAPRAARTRRATSRRARSTTRTPAATSVATPRGAARRSSGGRRGRRAGFSMIEVIAMLMIVGIMLLAIVRSRRPRPKVPHPRGGPRDRGPHRGGPEPVDRAAQGVPGRLRPGRQAVLAGPPAARPERPGRRLLGAPPRRRGRSPTRPPTRSWPGSGPTDDVEHGPPARDPAATDANSRTSSPSPSGRRPRPRTSRRACSSSACRSATTTSGPDGPRALRAPRRRPARTSWGSSSRRAECSCRSSSTP